MLDFSRAFDSSASGCVSQVRAWVEVPSVVRGRARVIAPGEVRGRAKVGGPGVVSGRARVRARVSVGRVGVGGRGRGGRSGLRVGVHGGG